MNVAELERLLEDAYRPGPGNRFKEMTDMAPDLIRRVIAAEGLIDSLNWYIEVLQNNNHDLTALQAIKAIQAYEATK